MKFNTFMFQNQQVMEAELIEEKAIPKGAFDGVTPSKEFAIDLPASKSLLKPDGL